MPYNAKDTTRRTRFVACPLLASCTRLSVGNGRGWGVASEAAGGSATRCVWVWGVVEGASRAAMGHLSGVSSRGVEFAVKTVQGVLPASSFGGQEEKHPENKTMVGIGVGGLSVVVGFFLEQWTHTVSTVPTIWSKHACKPSGLFPTRIAVMYTNPDRREPKKPRKNNHAG